LGGWRTLRGTVGHGDSSDQARQHGLTVRSNPYGIGRDLHITDRTNFHDPAHRLNEKT
jgi:hypothetical protein